MNQASNLALADSPFLQPYLSAFANMTGILVHYLPPMTAGDELSRAVRQHPFMRIVLRTHEGEATCLSPILAATTRMRRNPKPAKVKNVLGLIHVEVPLIVGGSVGGVLLAGPIATKTPNSSDYEEIARRITNWGLTISLQAVRAAYCAVPIVPSRRLQSTIAFLSLFANQLGESIHRWLLANRERNPHSVTAAKDFIQTHVTDRLTPQVIAHRVCLSADHFGKVFKKNTHMTLGEYISRVRVEHVKQQLLSESCRVIEAAFESGFQSVAQFNRIFKKYAGVNPSQYRASLHSTT